MIMMKKNSEKPEKNLNKKFLDMESELKMLFIEWMRALPQICLSAWII